MHFNNVAVFVFHAAGAGNDVAVFQAHGIAGEQTEIFLGRLFAEIIAFDPEFTAERKFALGPFGVVRV